MLYETQGVMLVVLESSLKLSGASGRNYLQEAVDADAVDDGVAAAARLAARGDVDDVGEVAGKLPEESPSFVSGLAAAAARRRSGCVEGV